LESVLKNKTSLYAIAEIGTNFNKDVKIARDYIFNCKDAGFDAVKFQYLSLKGQYFDEFYTKETKRLFDVIGFEQEWLYQFKEFAVEAEIEIGVSPTFDQALEECLSADLDFIKIASPQVFTKPHYIAQAAKSNKKIIASLGYLSWKEILSLIDKYKSLDNVHYLYCISQYPADIESFRLDMLSELISLNNGKIGISDHWLSNAPSAIGCYFGASIVEKHVTFDRLSPGPDHFFALELDEWKAYVKTMRDSIRMHDQQIKLLKGNEKISGKRDFSIAIPHAYRSNVTEYAGSKFSLKKGQIISSEHIIYKRVEFGLKTGFTNSNFLIGKAINVDLKEGMPFKRGYFV
jgi:N,N'-diacetyllegionaminate synthase